jgi:hypothetical protein
MSAELRYSPYSGWTLTCLECDNSIPVSAKQAHDEAFFCYAQPCGVCGAPCDELQPLEPGSDLLAGECCTPSEPLCAEFRQVVQAAQTVGELMDSAKRHITTCSECRGLKRKEPVQAFRLHEHPNAARPSSEAA